MLLGVGRRFIWTAIEVVWPARTAAQCHARRSFLMRPSSALVVGSVPRTLARRSPTRRPRLRSEICRAGTGFSRRNVQTEIQRMTAATASDTKASSGLASYSASFSRKVGDMGRAPLLLTLLAMLGPTMHAAAKASTALPLLAFACFLRSAARNIASSLMMKGRHPFLARSASFQARASLHRYGPMGESSLLVRRSP